MYLGSMNLKSGIWMLMTAVTFPLFAQSGRQFINLSDSRDFRGMQILDSALQQNRLMVLGINRAFPEINRTVSIKCIAYALNQAGYHYFLAPVSPTCGGWLNRLVYQNDFSALEDISLVLNNQEVLFYKRLNTLNEGLPDSLKIKVLGIDAENQMLIPALGLFNLFKDKIPPDRLRIPIESLQGAILYQQIKNGNPDQKNGKERFPVKNTFITFAGSFDSLKTVYQQWLGDDEWFQMENLMRGLKSAILYDQYRNTSLEDPYRIQQVSEHIATYMQNLPQEKFVSFMGRCYAAKTWLQGSCDLFNFSPVCNNLKEDSRLGHQIFNVGVYYSDPSDLEDEPAIVKTALEQLRTGVSENAVSLSRLKDPNSQNPFDFMLVMGKNSETLTYPKTIKEKSYPKVSAGISSGMHLANLNRLNNLMDDYGLPKVLPVQDYGFNFSLWDRNNNHYEAGYFQRAVTPGSAYQYWGTYLSAMGNLIPQNHWFKGGLGTSISYQQHRVNYPNNQNDTAFLTRYALPTSAINPALLFGITAKGILTLNRFFLSMEAGYGWDITDNRWIVNNKYSGPEGKFKADQFFFNVNAGMHLASQKRNVRKEEKP